MKNYLISVLLILFMASPLYGQSDDEKRFAFRSAFVAHALTYNLDKQNGVGFHFGQFTTELDEDNVKILEKSFFDCINITLIYSCGKMSKMESYTILLI